MLAQTISKSLRPNVLSYSAAISACEKASEAQVALALLQQAEATSLQPDIIMCNAAISACEKAADWQEALALLRRAQQRQPSWAVNVITFNATGQLF